MSARPRPRVGADLLARVDRGLASSRLAIAGFLGVPVAIVQRAVSIEAIAEVPGHLRDTELLTAACYVGMRGDLAGHCLFTVPAEAVEVLWRAAAGQAPPQPALVDSFLEELGNIAVSGFLNGLADAGGWRVVSTPPELAWSALGSCWQSVLAAVAASIESALVVTADWHVGQSGLACGVLVLPDRESMALLLGERA